MSAVVRLPVGTAMAEAETPLRVDGLTVGYGRKPVLWGVDYRAPASSLVAIVGPNGAGKSTLIKAVLGLLPLASGSIEFWGRPLAEMRRRVGYVPQRGSVDWDFPVSVEEVVTMGRYGMLGWLRPVAEWNPLTRVLGVARQGFVGGPDWSTTLTGIAAMAVLSVLTALFAFTGIRRLDA